jgi:large subunit ribosomal protein L23
MTQMQKHDAQKRDHRLLQIILAPLISEKSTRLSEKRSQAVFFVARDATKPEVKAAVELLFKVSVSRVQLLNQKGKVKRFGRVTGRRKQRKKAYVCLVPGQEIHFDEEVK